MNDETRRSLEISRDEALAELSEIKPIMDKLHSMYLELRNAYHSAHADYKRADRELANECIVVLPMRAKTPPVVSRTFQQFMKLTPEQQARLMSQISNQN